MVRNSIYGSEKKIFLIVFVILAHSENSNYSFSIALYDVTEIT